MFYRHGDLVIEATTEKPGGRERLKPGVRGHVLAEGEATGHAHRIAETDAAQLYRWEAGNDNGVRLLVVERPVALSHEEHGDIVLPAGRYKVRIKRQYSPDGWARVVD